MTIIIGRDQETGKLLLFTNGQDTLWGTPMSVPPTVNPQHCALEIDASSMRLTNLDINNYTYINGHCVESMAISQTDKIELGPDRYIFDWKAVQPLLPVDITSLREIWNDFENEKMQLQVSERRMNALRSITPVITMTALVLGFVTGRQSVWLIILYVLAILLSIGFYIKSLINARAIPEKQNKLLHQFQTDYKCPKCGKFLGNQSFDILIQNDGCPHCKTQFIH